jgi:hypothetical protein
VTIYKNNQILIMARENIVKIDNCLTDIREEQIIQLDTFVHTLFTEIIFLLRYYAVLSVIILICSHFAIPLKKTPRIVDRISLHYISFC